MFSTKFIFIVSLHIVKKIFTWTQTHNQRQYNSAKDLNLKNKKGKKNKLKKLQYETKLKHLYNILTFNTSYQQCTSH